MEARATGSCSRGFEAGRRHPLEAAAEVLRGAGGSLGGATKQKRRPLVEAAGRRNGRLHGSPASGRCRTFGRAGRRNERGDCIEATATGSCSGGFEGEAVSNPSKA